MESALFYYGYSDFSPRQWSIAVPRTFSRTKLKIDSLTTKVYSVQLAVYDRERTICDRFKYRTKKMRVYKKLMDVMEALLNG